MPEIKQSKPRINNRQVILILPFIFALHVALAWLSLNYLNAPWLWIGLALILTAFALVLATRGNIQAIFFNIVVVLITLTSYEAFLTFNNVKTFTANNIHTKKPVKTKHDILGYTLDKNAEVSVSGYYDGKEIFNVTCTTDENGSRTGPPVANPHTEQCIIFLGDSFTFGFGLQDDETASYQVGLKTDGKYQIYNFGCNGYGIHHVYAQLQNGIVQNAVGTQKPKAIIYQAILSHGYRASKPMGWDPEGPRYLLDEKGNVVSAGSFNDAEYRSRFEKNVIGKTILTALSRSKIFKNISRKRKLTTHELNLLISLTEAARNEALNIYPETKFYVILWKTKLYASQFDKCLEMLRKKGINVISANEIIKDYHEQMEKYVHCPGDFHPNANANQKVADYIVDNIVSN